MADADLNDIAAYIRTLPPITKRPFKCLDLDKSTCSC